MKAKSKVVKKTCAEKITITREIAAPCGMVYQAWSDPIMMAQWFSPEKVECRSVTADLRVGGAYRIHMVSEKGDHIAIGHYLQIVPRKRLKFTYEWEKYAMPESVVTVEFEDLGKTTRLTLTHEGFPDQEDADDHQHGWTSAVKKFARMMKQDKIKTPVKSRVVKTSAKENKSPGGSEAGKTPSLAKQPKHSRAKK